MKIQHINHIRDEIINTILEEFDFDKVTKIMKYMGWTWYFTDEVTSEMLKTSSIQKLKEVYNKLYQNKDTYSISSGGLKASGVWDKENGVLGNLQLEFILERSYYENS